jgi:hypothetical protein
MLQRAADTVWAGNEEGEGQGLVTWKLGSLLGSIAATPIGTFQHQMLMFNSIISSASRFWHDPLVLPRKPSSFLILAITVAGEGDSAMRGDQTFSSSHSREVVCRRSRLGTEIQKYRQIS